MFAIGQRRTEHPYRERAVADLRATAKDAGSLGEACAGGFGRSEELHMFRDRFRAVQATVCLRHLPGLAGSAMQ